MVRCECCLAALVVILGYTSERLARAADTASAPAIHELEPLAALAGQWEGDFVIGANSDNKMKAEQRSEWILDGWYLSTQTTARNDKGDTFKLMIVAGYDKEKQQYTRSFFFTGGGVFHERGSYDPITKTFTFTENDAQSGASKTTTAKVEDSDTIRWTMVIKKPGEAPLEVTGVNRRKK